jgi:energy-coupling factor transporter ATP-binding protein EcfA2
MVVCAYIEEHQYLLEEPQTLDFGGEYLYSFKPSGKNLIVSRRTNDKYIANFFNVSKSTCHSTLLSAIVDQNGVGKSSLLISLRGVFVPHVYSMPHDLLTVLIEVNGETKVLKSNYESVILKKDDTADNIVYDKIEKGGKENYQTIYYSPHFDLKYNKDFDEVDAYDISLDHFIKQDLAYTENKGTNENGWKFSLEEELLFKNSARQVEFLNLDVCSPINCCI